MTKEKGRADLGFDVAFDEVDASEWRIGSTPQRDVGFDAEMVKEVAEQSGFQSREARGARSAKKRKVVARMQKNFRPKVENCDKFDFLANLGITGKEGPELVDEALELLFKKYQSDLEFYDEFRRRKAEASVN